MDLIIICLRVCFWEKEEEQFCGVVKASKWLLKMLVNVSNKLYKTPKSRAVNIDWKYGGARSVDCKR